MCMSWRLAEGRHGKSFAMLCAVPEPLSAAERHKVTLVWLLRLYSATVSLAACMLCILAASLVPECCRPGVCVTVVA